MQSKLCWILLGDTPKPHLSYFLWRRERSKETSTYPKSFPIWKDLTENHGRPMIFRVLVWLAKPLPYGRAIFSYIPAVAAPWKGAQPEAEKALIDKKR